MHVYIITSSIQYNTFLSFLFPCPFLVLPYSMQCMLILTVHLQRHCSWRARAHSLVPSYLPLAGMVALLKANKLGVPAGN
jgi:hypothetical protein